LDFDSLVSTEGAEQKPSSWANEYLNNPEEKKKKKT